jgi:hypothetical protein
MPSLKNVREILNQAKFNPKDPGPLNVVAHSSGPSYLEMRSMEFIMEAQIDRSNLRDLANLIVDGIPTDTVINEDNLRAAETFKSYKQKMLRAIQCLSLAIIKVENGEF